MKTKCVVLVPVSCKVTDIEIECQLPFMGKQTKLRDLGISFSSAS